MENKDEILLQFGKNVREIRKLKHLTQEQLANNLDVSLNFISMLELGRCGVSISTIVKLCNVLQADPNMLFKNITASYDDLENSLILNSLNNFNKDDKNAVIDLINYINKSKS